LTDKQRHAIELLATGVPVGETAETIGVDRRTLLNWRKKNKQYQIAYKEAMGDAEHVSVREARAALAEIYAEATTWVREWFDKHRETMEPKEVIAFLEYLRKATEGGSEKTTIKKNLTVNQKVDLPNNRVAFVDSGRLRVVDTGEEEHEEIEAEVVDASSD
jgi:transposase-like protein